MLCLRGRVPLYVSTAATAYRTHRLADTVTGQQTKVSRREELPVLQPNPNTPGYQPTSIMNRCILWLGAYASRACRCHHPVPPSVSAVTLPLGRVGWQLGLTMHYQGPNSEPERGSNLESWSHASSPSPPAKDQVAHKARHCCSAAQRNCCPARKGSRKVVSH